MAPSEPRPPPMPTPEIVQGGPPRWCRGWWSAARACPSPNAGERPPGCRPSLLVLHSISLPPGQYGGDQIERLFTNRLDWSEHPYFETIRDLQVSAHFLIRRDGALLQFVSADRRAWHAGPSCWAGRENCNDWSIGVELEGLEGHCFEPAQYAALVALAAAIAQQYPVDEVVGHEHIAPGRKLDPGPGLHWHDLLSHCEWPPGIRCQVHGVEAAATAAPTPQPGR